MNPNLVADVPLAQLLRTAARELQTAEPPPLRAACAPPSARRSRRVGILAGRAPALRFAWSGAAACLLLLVGSAWLLMRAPDAGPDALPLARASGYLPVTPVEQWTRADGGADAAWLVSTEMPNERLAALGLPYDPARAGETVRAELLMRATGEVLAVRVVR